MIMLVIVIGVLPAGDHRVGHVGNEAETIRVRKDAGQRHELAIAWISRGGGRDQPAS